MDDDKWDSFEALVSWAAWYMVEAMLKGEALRKAMYHVVSTARMAQFKEPTK